MRDQPFVEPCRVMCGRGGEWELGNCVSLSPAHDRRLGLLLKCGLWYSRAVVGLRLRCPMRSRCCCYLSPPPSAPHCVSRPGHPAVGGAVTSSQVCRPQDSGWQSGDGSAYSLQQSEIWESGKLSLGIWCLFGWTMLEDLLSISSAGRGDWSSW